MANSGNSSDEAELNEVLECRSMMKVLKKREKELIHNAETAWPHLTDLQLADPDFAVPAEVDVILGVDVYGQVVRGEICRGEPGAPTAQLTAFGWVLMGTLLSGEALPSPAGLLRVSVNVAQPAEELSTILRRFWEMEEFPEKPILTPDKEWTENHYKETHSRDATGRYVVRLPRVQSRVPQLGDSRAAALSMLLSSERRMTKQCDLRKRYTAFMVEYLALGHMDPIPVGTPSPATTYYLPHHAVFKAGDVAGKIRVVFNASCRTSSGHLLNDCLLPGPRLQTDLWLVLSRWR
ncbi:PREDICTED: uncharacterized protein LOC105449094 [Wasmannia auropunctata]|uniref:uncharacterized protein LOC105449094 n=1 Tax=Wasmannia auropunctata TaxID=64793 RepID=UPI0005ED7B07|nr:PREDICTED: uncharacterized protein LOC105449094 [Wasmannia auropunctata]